MDSYQAVYDAVRSRISNGDIGAAVQRVAYEMLDVSYAKALLQEQIGLVGGEMVRPSVLYRPTLAADGSMWCALLGTDLQTGIAGFGETPAAAMAAFDMAFFTEPTPAAVRASHPSRATGDDSAKEGAE